MSTPNLFQISRASGKAGILKLELGGGGLPENSREIGMGGVGRPAGLHEFQEMTWGEKKNLRILDPRGNGKCHPVCSPVSNLDHIQTSKNPTELTCCKLATLFWTKPWQKGNPFVFPFWKTYVNLKELVHGSHITVDSQMKRCTEVSGIVIHHASPLFK